MFIILKIIGVVVLAPIVIMFWPSIVCGLVADKIIDEEKSSTWFLAVIGTIGIAFAMQIIWVSFIDYLLHLGAGG